MSGVQKVIRDVHTLQLSGNVNVAIEESGQICVLNESNPAAFTVLEKSDGVVEIKNKPTYDSVITCSGGIASVTGGSAAIINGGGSMIISNGRTTFGRNCSIERTNGALHIQLPSEETLYVNGKRFSVAQLMSDGGGLSSTTAGSTSARSTTAAAATTMYFLASTHLKQIEMCGSSSLQLHQKLLQASNSLHIKMSGSSKLTLPSCAKTFASVKVATSGAAEIALGLNTFERVALHSSGASTIRSLVALHDADVQASGASHITLSVYAREIVRQTCTGVAKVQIKLYEQ